MRLSLVTSQSQAPSNMAPRKRTASAKDGSTATGNGTQKRKRTRFVSPGSDPANFEEQVDATLENPSAARKGRVRTEGYDSDSSDDGEGVVESRKKTTKKDEDGDEDMFAMADQEDTEEKEGRKKKDNEFLKLGDIEGQEFADGGGSSGEGSSEEDEPEDEDDAERRRKAGMGYELSGFNMREEMEEGKFAADGTFVRTFDPHGVHDRWMDGLDEREIKKARRNKKIREREEKERIKKEERDALGKEDAEKELVEYLRKGESVVEALHRLGIAAKRDKDKQYVSLTHHTTPTLTLASSLPSQKNPIGIDVDSMRPSSTRTAPFQGYITRITDLASTLMSHGNTDIYSAPYEQLLRSVRAAGKVSSDWVPASQQVQYEYRWALPEQTLSQDQPQVYGPYQHEEMLAWHGAKYFGDEGEKVRVRKLGENGWHEWDDIMF